VEVASGAGGALREDPLRRHQGQDEYHTLPQLAKQRTKSVQDILNEAVEEYLSQSNFNTLGEIKKALGRIGAEEAVLGPYGAFLEPMMRRRHHIVHRADRNDKQGAEQHAARSIAQDDVTAWRDADHHV